MKFTTDLPASPGFYAWRFAADTMRHATEVFVNSEGELIVNIKGQSEFVKNKGGQWCKLVPQEVEE